MSLHQAAQHLASRGRGEDSLLIHMTPGEVGGLQALAQAHGQGLTINPDTGLPEAGILSSILPMVIGAGLSMIPGVGPAMAAGITGVGYAAATGSLQKGLMAGMGAYGGGNIATGLADMGASSMANQAAAPELATLNNVASTMPGGVENAAFMGPMAASDLSTLTGAQDAYAKAYLAAPTPDKWSSFQAGLGGMGSGPNGGLNALANNMGGNSAAMKYAGMAAAPFFADLAVPRPVTTTQAPQGMVRPMQFSRRQIPGGQQTGDAYTGERRFFEDGLKQFPAYNPTERGYAGGGAVMDVPGFADGGVPEGWAVNGNNWYRNGEVYSPAQAQALIAAAAPPPALTPPAGWEAQPGGEQYYRVNPVAGGQNILTESQAANLWGVANPERYAPAQTPVAPPTPTYGMGEDGSIGSVADPRFQYGQQQAQQGAGMLDQQLLASGANTVSGMPPPVVTNPGGQTTPYNAPPAPTAAPSGIASLAPAYGATAAPAVLGYGASGQATPAAGGTSGFLSADAAAYYARYPDVKAAWDAQGQYTQGLNPTQFAQLHYETWGGPKEQRIWGVQAAPTPAPAPAPVAGPIIDRVPPPTGTPAPAPAPVGGTPAPAPAPAGGTPAPAPAPVGGTPAPTPAPAPSPPVGGPQRDLSVTLAMPWGSAARDYFMQNPDVADGFRTNNFGMSADDFARMHFEKFGRNEGRYFRGQSQPRVTRANPFNTTKGASRNALEYLAGEASLAPQAGVTQYQPPSLAGIDKLMAKTKEQVQPDEYALSYMNRYPDVYLAYQEDPMGMDVNTFMRTHYQKFGRDEQRIWEVPRSTSNVDNTSGTGTGGDGAGDSGGGPGEGSAGDLARGGSVRGRGIAALAAGGQGRLLRGPGDGVSDSIPATINGGQPAALADGEFVVPARIVSELGNGSTEAGARQLYAMLDRIQKRRGATTGKGKVAIDSGAHRVLPA